MTQAPVTGFRLSPQQRHVWQLQRDSRAYRAQVSLHLTGDLRREALEEALAGVISQHQIFRTAFQRTPGVRFPIQVVREEATARWRHLDYSDRDGAAVEKLFDKERKKPFDLDRGPVVHATLVARGAEEHVLILGLPALVADAASLQLLVRDLAAAYGAAAGSEDESVQYVQFSEWQNEMVESEEAKPGRDFWQALEVPSLHALELPFGASDAGAFAPERVPLVLEPGTAERLAELGGAEVVLLAAWRALLWRLTGESEGGWV